MRPLAPRFREGQNTNDYISDEHLRSPPSDLNFLGGQAKQGVTLMRTGYCIGSGFAYLR